MHYLIVSLILCKILDLLRSEFDFYKVTRPKSYIDCLIAKSTITNKSKFFLLQAYSYVICYFKV